MNKFLLITAIILLAFFPYKYNISQQPPRVKDKPKISITFDDGSIKDMPGYKLEEWNQMILDQLKRNHLKSILFACGSILPGEKGQYIINSWDKAGNKIANHTYSHLSFNSKKLTLNDYENDFLRNDSMIRHFPNFIPYFRFPYLKEGNTSDKISGFRTFLKKQNYHYGHVTVDASDWYINDRMIKRLKEQPNADISGYRNYYIQHLFTRALFYDSLAVALTGREINHVLILHHNLAAALFLTDLIQYFEAHGWVLMDADKAYLDEIYKTEPTNIPAGESLIWALAKQSGKFEGVLRYPGEEGDYEKIKMDKLGL